MPLRLFIKKMDVKRKKGASARGMGD